MALNERQEELYLDRLAVYRGGGKDGRGNPLGSAQPVADLQDVPCKLFSTENFDDVQGPQGRTKVANIMTSDVVHLESGLDVRADDVVRILQAGLSTPQWFSVSGAPKVRPAQGERETNYQKAFLTTRKAPEGL